MPNTAIIYVVKNNIAHLTLNRPEADNFINQQIARGLEDVCCRINQNNDIHVVIITGSGTKMFCAGGELNLRECGCNPANAIAGIGRPVIAAINGDALGEGLELALACDIRIASSKATFSLPRITEGLIPVHGGTQRLPRIVGRSKALEMLLTAETINAGEALETGLVNRVVSAEKLAAEAETLAKTISAKGPVALRYIKEAVNKGMELTQEQGLQLEADLYFLLQTTADRTEGIEAFRKKRPPHFQGR